MNAKLLLCAAMVSAVLCSAVFAQDPPEDPFGGGFAINQDAEIFTLGLTSSLRGGAFDWLSDLDTILTIWSGSFPGTSGICLKRDIAAANFNSDYFDEMVVAWSRSDNGVFVGIPTIDPVTMAPDPAGWHVPDPPGAAGALYATDNLADLLGGIRVVVGNFYADPTMEFVLAYLAADSTVFLSVFDVDTATLTPVLKGTISDQAVNTEVEASQLSDWMSRFDVATGDLDGDGLDEIVLVANDPAQSPGTDLMVDVYDYDTLAHAIVPVSKMRFTANDNLNHTCLRRLAAEAANFDADSRDEIALVHRWANPVNDTSRVGTMNILKLNSEMTVIDYSSDEALPTVPRWGPVNGVSGDICNMTVYNDDLIVGGDFTAAGGISANYIARWDGTNWYPLGSGLNATVLRLTVYNGELIAGGKFTSAGGVSAKYIARWDGSA